MHVINRRTDDDDADIVRDGERVRVPMYLMDATQRAVAAPPLHRPGHAFGDAASAGVAFAAERTREVVLADRWRSAPVDRAPLSVDAAYDQRDRLLTSAWRTPE